MAGNNSKIKLAGVVMRAQLEKLSSRKENQSFSCYEVKEPSFDFFWHYHPEYELTYIVKGKGKRLVGNIYEPFSAGDFVLLGPDIPHTWISDKIKNQNCRAIVIQFSTKFVESILQFDELKALKKILQKAEKGFQFMPTKKNNYLLLIQEMITKDYAEKFLLFIQLLLHLSTSKGKTLLTTSVKPLKGSINQHRINKVFQYVQNDYKKNISLKKAAALIHLSKSAFCKYFKRASGKTFSDYVNEIRIAYACQLLIETDYPISQIAFDSGFESLNYFNRVFLKKKKIIPSEFRKLIESQKKVH
ncbi:MAG: AraC family transcriptional regulator [Bacteroidetes bacterium]|nr:AraC family transcriptional regulator [Bacteroidota bacterium]